MNPNDFAYFQRGVVQSLVPPADYKKIASISIDNGANNKALLLLHGFSSTPNTYLPLIESLTKYYDAIYAPLLPKHGMNVGQFSSLTGNDLCRFAKKIGQDLTARYQQVDVVGLSLGGVLAHYLSSCCAINQLFLLAPAFSLHLPISSSIVLTKILTGIGFKFLYNRAGNVYVDAQELAYRLLPLTTIKEILLFIREYSFSPPTCPTTVMLGAYDRVVHSNRVAKLFAASNTSVIWLKNSAHLLPLDGDKNRIIEIIESKI